MNVSKCLIGQKLMNLLHLDYQIDKKKYRDIFWSMFEQGKWYVFKDRELGMRWWKVYGIEEQIEDVAHDLNIHGMNNFPRFAYLFKGHDLPWHVDEDYMTSIMINLMDGPSPVVHIEDHPEPYECMVWENGNLFHEVKAREENSLMLKFCIRHPWEEVCERLSALGYV